MLPENLIQQLSEEFHNHIRSFSRLIYVVTDEEDRFIDSLAKSAVGYKDTTFIYNPTMGLKPIGEYQAEWSHHTHTVSQETVNIHEALITAYKSGHSDEPHLYVFQDAERWMRDDHAVRRILNIVHQLGHDDHSIKFLIFLGSRKAIPEKLTRYVEVFDHRGLSDTEVTTLVTSICERIRVPVPSNAVELFRGLTSFEVEAAILQSSTKTKLNPPRRVEPQIIAEYRRKQLSKTDLVSYVDTSSFDMADVGGLARFKSWAKETAAVWTEQGQAFGLEPPRGVLLMGIYGCGKSLSTKALAKSWGLPLVQLEIGRLMSSGVGDSENNLYRALRLIESVSPCVVWVDEAEKSLAGAHSSSRSDGGTTARVLGILSTWVQETKAKVTLALTANSLKTLPVEMVNRMDERFFFDLPTEDDLIDILKIHIRANRADPSTYNLASLAECAGGLVGREVQQAVKKALIRSFNEGAEGLSEAALAAELKGKPRIVNTMTDEIKEILDWVGYDPERDEGVKARFAGELRPGVRVVKG